MSCRGTPPFSSKKKSKQDHLSGKDTRLVRQWPHGVISVSAIKTESLQKRVVNPSPPRHVVPDVDMDKGRMRCRGGILAETSDKPLGLRPGCGIIDQTVEHLRITDIVTTEDIEVVYHAVFILVNEDVCGCAPQVLAVTHITE